MRNNSFFIVTIGLLLVLSNSYGQEPVSVVEKFGSCFEGYFGHGDVDCRIELDNLTSGEIKCIVDNKISQTQKKGTGSVEIDTYFNYFELWAEKGNINVRLDDVVWEKNFKVPTAYNEKSKEPLNFVRGNLKVNGYVNYDCSDLYFVRGGKITEIVDFNDDLSLGNAVRLYSERKYDEAFQIFRTLAYKDCANYKAQYYTAVMELKKQGCDFLDSKIRDMEAAWWCLKGLLSSGYYAAQDLAKLAYRFSVTDKGFPYSGLPYGIMSLRYERPFNHGLMVSRGKNGLFGYVDERNSVIIPHRYPFAFRFDDIGLALVVDGNRKMGYINKRGETVIPLIYDGGCSKFVDKKSFVISGEWLCLIDAEGQILRRISGYNDIKSVVVDNHVMAKKNQKGQVLYDILDFDGNIIHSDCDRIETYQDGITVIGYKEGKSVFSGSIKW